MGFKRGSSEWAFFRVLPIRIPILFDRNGTNSQKGTWPRQVGDGKHSMCHGPCNGAAGFAEAAVRKRLGRRRLTRSSRKSPRIWFIGRRMALLQINENGLYCSAGDFLCRSHGDRVDFRRHHPCALRFHARTGLASLSHGRSPVDRFLPGAVEASRLEFKPFLMVKTVHAEWSFHFLCIQPDTSSVPPRYGFEFGGEVWVVSGDYKVEAGPDLHPL